MISYGVYNDHDDDRERKRKQFDVHVLNKNFFHKFEKFHDFLPSALPSFQ